LKIFFDFAQLRERLTEEGSTDVPQPDDQGRQRNAEVLNLFRNYVRHHALFGAGDGCPAAGAASLRALSTEGTQAAAAAERLTL
jgi:hypothetical protein